MNTQIKRHLRTFLVLAAIVLIPLVVVSKIQTLNHVGSVWVATIIFVTGYIVSLLHESKKLSYMLLAGYMLACAYHVYEDGLNGHSIFNFLFSMANYGVGHIAIHVSLQSFIAIPVTANGIQIRTKPKLPATWLQWIKARRYVRVILYVVFLIMTALLFLSLGKANGLDKNPTLPNENMPNITPATTDTTSFPAQVADIPILDDMKSADTTQKKIDTNKAQKELKHKKGGEKGKINFQETGKEEVKSYLTNELPIGEERWVSTCAIDIHNGQYIDVGFTAENGPFEIYKGQRLYSIYLVDVHKDFPCGNHTSSIGSNEQLPENALIIVRDIKTCNNIVYALFKRLI